jgi:hypothetical protein
VGNGLIPITRQANNTALGDIVGGSKTTTNISFNSPVSMVNSQFDRFYRKFKDEQEQGLVTAGIDEALQHYISSPTDGDVRGLEEKLIAAGRQNDLYLAKQLKERAMKSIMRHETSRTAQRIYTLILDELHTSFSLTATPLIQQNAGDIAIDQSILKIIRETSASLGENVLDLSMKDIWALLYYLGGNCHIRWDKC